MYFMAVGINMKDIHSNTLFELQMYRVGSKFRFQIFDFWVSRECKQTNLELNKTGYVQLHHAKTIFQWNNSTKKSIEL